MGDGPAQVEDHLGDGNPLVLRLPIEIRESHPLRIGSFRDVNGAVEFLINNDSGWFTGQNFILDGGYSSQ